MRTIHTIPALALASLSVFAAPPPAAPVPVQILNAKKVFISNAGGEVNRDAPSFGAGYTEGPDRAYNRFYAALKGSGQFELVLDPGEADLVLEIRFHEPYTWRRSAGEKDYASDPQLRLVVLDPKTRVTLWGLTEHIAPAAMQSNRDKNFDQVIDDFVARLRALRARPA